MTFKNFQGTWKKTGFRKALVVYLENILCLLNQLFTYKWILSKHPASLQSWFVGPFLLHRSLSQSHMFFLQGDGKLQPGFCLDTNKF